MRAEWYVLHCKPRKESCVAGQLRAAGLVYFFPTVKSNPVNPRACKVKPFLPGYLFVKLDIPKGEKNLVRWMAGTRGLVRLGGQPARMPETVVAALRAKLAGLNAGEDENAGRYTPGDAVEILKGPLNGYRGIFDLKRAGSARVKVLLSMLNGQQVRLELPSGYIQTVKPV